MSETALIELFRNMPAIITAFAAVLAAIASIIGMIISRDIGRKMVDVKAAVAEVKTEVKTTNAQSIAQLADNAESRRIDLIPADKRTQIEAGHVQSVERSDQAIESIYRESAITKERDKQAAAGTITKSPSEEGKAREGEDKAK